MASTIRTGLRSSVAKNAASLYVIQFANYILPLITVPYLVRVLGPTGYGTIAFGRSLIAYFALFVDYGFALSATRKISVKRNDPIAVSRIAFSVWAAKILLCTVGFAVLLPLVTVVPKLRDVSVLLLILYGLTVGNALFPTWLFQGMERMVSISVINLVMRFFVVIGIFTMIHRPEDYLLYGGLTSFGSIAAGVVGAGVAFWMFQLRPVIPSWRGIQEALAEGWTLFLSTASVSLYTTGNALILGLLTNHTVVGYYSAAERIVKAVAGLLGPISQAVYPRFSKMASESKSSVLYWARRGLLLQSSLGLFLSIALFVGAPVIVQVVLGTGYEPSITVMRMLAALPLIIGIGSSFGRFVLLPFRKDRTRLFIFLIAGFTNVTLAFLLTPMWFASGMALAVLVSEVFVTLGFFVYLRINNLSPI